MTEPLLIEQDGRRLRVTLNRREDNGVTDRMAEGAQRPGALEAVPARLG